VFAVRVQTESGEVSLLDQLVLKYHQAENVAVAAVASGAGLPKPFQAGIAVEPEGDGVPLQVLASGRWKFYRAKLDAYEVNGSYEFTHGDFKGQFATPPIDTWRNEPGPGWELLDGTLTVSGNVAVLVPHSGNAKQALLNAMGPRALEGG